MDQRSRSYNILALTQGVLGGVTAVAIFLLYIFQYGALPDPSLMSSAAVLGLLAFLYWVSLHQLLKRRWLGLSALFLTLITGANLVLVIDQTGGVDSPFYSVWLLGIVTSGVFGPINTIVTLALTTAYFILTLYQHHFQANFIVTHIPQYLITMAAAGLGIWIWHRGRRLTTPVPPTQINALAGQLGAEQLKAQALLDNIADGVVAVDTHLRVQVLNRAAQILTGWDEESAVGIDYRKVLKLQTSNDQPLEKERDPFLAAWRAKVPIARNDLTLRTKSERKYVLTFSVSPLFGVDGQPSAAIAIFRDISAEKEAERQRSEFISTASHEMRTPIAAIEGYIALAINPKVATIDDRARGFLGKAQQNIHHLGELFRDLLSISKMEDRAIKANLVPTELGQVVKDIIADETIEANKKNLKLIFNPTRSVSGGKTIEPLYVVMVDPERIREVLTNLLSNSIKFTAQGSITVSITGDQSTVMVSVADTGIGIPSEDLPHLFQKFYRVDSSATRTIGGTGLGLYLSRQIIELYGGRIWVESTLAKGSVFFFTLPRIDSANLQQTPSPPAPAARLVAAETDSPHLGTDSLRPVS